MAVDTSAVGATTGAFRVALERSVLAHLAKSVGDTSPEYRAADAPAPPTFTITDVYEKETDTARMTFVVMETAWRDASDGSPVVTERFNLIARIRK